MIHGGKIMNEEMISLLNGIAVAIPIGLLLGIVLRKMTPSWCKSYTKFCMNRKWWLFLFGTVGFLAMAIMSFANDTPYFGVFFLLFAGFAIYVLIRYGFKSLTPEQEAEINASDPTKLWPVSFRKQTKIAESSKTKDAEKSNPKT
jgi:uncharacterized membrane protein